MVFSMHFFYYNNLLRSRKWIKKKKIFFKLKFLFKSRVIKYRIRIKSNKFIKLKARLQSNYHTFYSYLNNYNCVSINKKNNLIFRLKQNKVMALSFLLNYFTINIHNYYLYILFKFFNNLIFLAGYKNVKFKFKVFFSFLSIKFFKMVFINSLKFALSNLKLNKLSFKLLNANFKFKGQLINKNKGFRKSKRVKFVRRYNFKSFNLCSLSGFNFKVLNFFKNNFLRGRKFIFKNHLLFNYKILKKFIIFHSLKRRIKFKIRFNLFQKFRRFQFNFFKHQNNLNFIFLYKKNIKLLFRKHFFISSIKKNIRLSFFLLCSFVRGLSFNATLGQHILALNNKFVQGLTFLPFFSIYVPLIKGDLLESRRSKEKALVYYYYKHLKLNFLKDLSAKIPKIFQQSFLVKFNLFIKRNIYYRLFKRTHKHINQFLKFKINRHRKLLAPGKLLLQNCILNHLKINIFNALKIFNFNLIVHGLQIKNKTFKLLNPVKIFSYRVCYKLQQLTKLLQAYSYISLRNSYNIRFTFNKFFKKLFYYFINLQNLKLFFYFIFIIYLKLQFKKLLKKQLLCHN